MDDCEPAHLHPELPVAQHDSARQVGTPACLRARGGSIQPASRPSIHRRASRTAFAGPAIAGDKTKVEAVMAEIRQRGPQVIASGHSPMARGRPCLKEVAASWGSARRRTGERFGHRVMNTSGIECAGLPVASSNSAAQQVSRDDNCRVRSQKTWHPRCLLEMPDSLRR
jgi:hypothetical protein